MTCNTTHTGERKRRQKERKKEREKNEEKRSTPEERLTLT
jgi:hypothetical protein